jgi:Amidase
MISEYDKWDATDMARAVARKDVTPEELLTEALARCEAVNPKINAVVLLQDESSRRMIAQGLPRGPFTGVPFLLKDLGCEAINFPSHNGSRLFENTRYTCDSEIYTRMVATGLVRLAARSRPNCVGCVLARIVIRHRRVPVPISSSIRSIPTGTSVVVPDTKASNFTRKAAFSAPLQSFHGRP